METLKKPKAPKKVVKAISPEDITCLLGILNGRDFNSVRNKAILLLVLDTGLRLSEIASLKVSDIRNETILIMGKGAKQRIVRLGTKAQKCVWRYSIIREQVAFDCDSLWVSRDGQPLGSEGIRQMVVHLDLPPSRISDAIETLLLYP